MNTNVDSIAKSIGFPKEYWEGNCHAIACLIVEMGIVEGKVERGHYYGKVTKDSIFAGRGLVPHSWIRLEDGRVYDPTRFAFSNSEPSIFISKDSDTQVEYDIGGCRYRMNRPLPQFDRSKPKVELNFETKECEEFVNILLNNPPFLTANEAFFLGNTPFTKLGNFAKEIYEALIEADWGSAIPIDSREYILN